MIRCLNFWESYYPNAVVHIPKENSIIFEYPFLVGFYDVKTKTLLNAFLFGDASENSPWLIFDIYIRLILFYSKHIILYKLLQWAQVKAAEDTSSRSLWTTLFSISQKLLRTLQEKLSRRWFILNKKIKKHGDLP